MAVRCARFLKWGQLPAVAIASVLLGAGHPGERVPLHGGATFSMMAASLVPDVGFTEPLGPSNPYILVVTLHKDGPVAEAILASSQTPDPSSPFHSDQTRLYATKTWVRLPFTRTEVEAAAIAPPTILTIGADER